MYLVHVWKQLKVPSSDLNPVLWSGSSKDTTLLTDLQSHKHIVPHTCTGRMTINTPCACRTWGDGTLNWHWGGCQVSWLTPSRPVPAVSQTLEKLTSGFYYVENVSWDVHRFIFPLVENIYSTWHQIRTFSTCSNYQSTHFCTSESLFSPQILLQVFRQTWCVSVTPATNTHTHTRAHRHTYKHARCWSGLAWIMGSEITTCRPSPVISSFLCLYAPSVYLSFGITTALFIPPSHAYNVCDFFHQPPSLSLPLPRL